MIRIGLDFGIKSSITTSDAQTYNISFEESRRLKRFQRKLQKSQKDSNNKYKIRKEIRKEYEKLSRKKKDKANKIVASLFSNYEVVYFQDENLQGWKKRFGRKMQHSCLGRIKFLLSRDERATMIGRFEPTTKRCYCCGEINILNLSDRIFQCSNCGYANDRDVKAAIMIKMIGERVRYGAYQSSDDIIDERNISSSIKIAYGVMTSVEIRNNNISNHISYDYEVRRC